MDTPSPYVILTRIQWIGSVVAGTLVLAGYNDTGSAANASEKKCVVD